MSRPVVLLLHAFPLDSRMWEEQRPALEEAGYAVLAPDLPGEGPVVGFADWAHGVLGLVRGPLVPVGCSMGGYLALELWRQAPERIPGLALVDSRATPDTPEQRAGRDAGILRLREEGVQPFWAGLAPKLFPPGADPEVVARARELALAQPVDGLVASLETLRDRPDSRPTLATIDVPVLLVVGEEDELTPPADAEAMAEELVASRLVRLPGAGHLTPLERPAEVTRELLAFLEEAEE
ncbi:MAG TPA: alpha/beta fold hydrolase [Gaiellaceae bacterium]|nr:alpha/beta fold hydrolase [Gaiellaceae bacterium]